MLQVKRPCQFMIHAEGVEIKIEEQTMLLFCQSLLLHSEKHQSRLTYFTLAYSCLGAYMLVLMFGHSRVGILLAHQTSVPVSP